mmetsp:Transcript_73510/g.212735  ORF Transcript_73510/g.212735 Transcript_73510/m.212735 type:complete len:275 (+) Transcript_73510:1213-2037(+)
MRVRRGCRVLQKERRLRPEDHGRVPERGLDGAEGGGVWLPPLHVRDQEEGHGSHRGEWNEPGVAGAQGERRGHLPLLPDEGRTHQGLGEVGREAVPRERLPEQRQAVQGHFLAGLGPPARRDPDGQGEAVLAGARHRGPGHRGHVAHGGHPGDLPAREGRPEHHHCHRQCPPRLPHGPLPDLGARHLGEDVVCRAHARGRRHVRDRRRRVRAEARAAVPEGGAPPVGLPRRVLGLDLRLPGSGGQESEGQGVSRRLGQGCGHFPRREQEPFQEG